MGVPTAECRGAVTIAAWGEDQVRISAVIGGARLHRRGSSTRSKGVWRGPRWNRDRRELGRGVRLVSFGGGFGLVGGGGSSLGGVLVGRGFRRLIAPRGGAGVKTLAKVARSSSRG